MPIFWGAKVGLFRCAVKVANYFFSNKTGRISWQEMITTSCQLEARQKFNYHTSYYTRVGNYTAYFFNFDTTCIAYNHQSLVWTFVFCDWHVTGTTPSISLSLKVVIKRSPKTGWQCQLWLYLATKMARFCWDALQFGQIWIFLRVAQENVSIVCSLKRMRISSEFLVGVSCAFPHVFFWLAE